MKELFKVGDKVGSMRGNGILKHWDDKYAQLVIGDINNGLYSLETGRIKTCERYHEYPSIWHKETGTPPSTGERPFEYPIYKRRFNGLGCIVKFIDAHTFEYLDGGQKGEIAESIFGHADSDVWEDCEPPQEPKELTVAEIEKEPGYSIKVVK